MAQMKSKIVLSPDENFVMELEAELWASSSNPIARFIGAIMRVIYLILGIRRHAYIVLTDKRVIEVIQQHICWVFNGGKNVRYILPASVKEVGYTKEATFFCFCQAYNLYYDSFTQRTSVLLQAVSEAETQEIVDKFYATISNAQK